MILMEVPQMKDQTWKLDHLVSSTVKRWCGYLFVGRADTDECDTEDEINQ